MSYLHFQTSETTSSKRFDAAAFFPLFSGSYIICHHQNQRHDLKAKKAWAIQGFAGNHFNLSLVKTVIHVPLTKTSERAKKISCT